jgi:hypothetical protein
MPADPQPAPGAAYQPAQANNRSVTACRTFVPATAGLKEEQ